MADNTILPGAGDVIASDDVTTLNGGASSGVKVQRMKVGFGPDASHRDVSGAYPLPVTVTGDRVISYVGRASTFRTPGRAGTTGQKLLTIHNATGSAVQVDVEQVTVDMTATVVKAVTVLPPVIRLYRCTVLPTNGTALTKQPRLSSQASSSSVTILGDASADGTNSTTALTATVLAGSVAQCFAPRIITAVGYETIDRLVFLDGPDELITLRPLEGIVLALDYTLATQNPVTDMWICNVKWVEYTPAP